MPMKGKMRDVRSVFQRFAHETQECELLITVAPAQRRVKKGPIELGLGNATGLTDGTIGAIAEDPGRYLAILRPLEVDSLVLKGEFHHRHADRPGCREWSLARHLAHGFVNLEMLVQSARPHRNILAKMSFTPVSAELSIAWM